MDVKTLLALAALNQRNGQCDIAQQLLARACSLEGFDSYVSEVIRMPMNSSLVGGVPQSENTLAPSLHGYASDDIEQIVATAAAIYTRNSLLDEGDALEFHPTVAALADAGSGVDFSGVDDDSLVSTSSDQMKPGRIRIRIAQ